MKILSKQNLINVLKQDKEYAPEFSAFGDNNHEQIETAIYVLENGFSMDDVYDMEYDYEVESYISSIFDYLEGNVNLEDLLFGDLENYNITEDKSQRCKSACTECPFSSKSPRGFLADYDANDFLTFMNLEIAFPCHMTMGEVDIKAEETQKKIESGEMKLCRGYLESMIKSCKSPRNSFLKKHIDEIRNNLSDHTMSIFEFMKHHDKEKIFNQ